MQTDSFQPEVDTLNAAQWDALLEDFEDASIYQTSAYAASRWRAARPSRLTLRRGCDVVAMAQVGIVAVKGFRCGIAYLRWGPVFQRKGSPADPTVASAIVKALYREYVIKRGFCLRVLPHGFCGTARAAMIEAAFDEFTSEALPAGRTTRTFVVDLGPCVADLRRRLDQKWRNQLNRAEKNNLRLVTAKDHNAMAQFEAIYWQMLSRKGIREPGDIRTFKRMQHLLPERLRMSIVLCFEGDELCAGGIYTALGNTGIYLFGATADTGLRNKASYLIQWRIVNELKDQGIRYYDLGGINPEVNPNVFHFKKGLAGTDMLYMVPRAACNSFWSMAFTRAADVIRGGMKFRPAHLLRRRELTPVPA